MVAKNPAAMTNGATSVYTYPAKRRDADTDADSHALRSEFCVLVQPLSTSAEVTVRTLDEILRDNFEEIPAETTRFEGMYPFCTYGLFHLYLEHKTVQYLTFTPTIHP